MELRENKWGVSGPVMIAVMDGIGLGKRDEGDAVFKAKTPNLDRLASNKFASQLSAHGIAVGMPSDGDMGNSEVGHNCIGAGRIFDQGAKLVGQAIQTGRILESQAWKTALEGVIRHGKTLHFLGLLSDGNVHSHIDHLLALMKHAAQAGVKSCRVHVLLDGRDVEETSALLYVEALDAALEELNRSPDLDYAVASGGGRMTTTMDRYEADWPMVERGWNAHVHGIGRGFESTRAAIETFRAEQPGITDQNLPQFVIHRDGQPVGKISDGDSVLALNFRGDRMIEISRAFEDESFEAFDRGQRPHVFYAGMMQYDGDAQIPRNFLVEPPLIDATMSELLCARDISQFACSETQKFGHVTYFWNGNRSGYFAEKLETYIEIPSDNVPFETTPEMKAAEITNATLKAIESDSFKFGRVNYANGDMVGHTGHFDATVQSVECVDREIGRLANALTARGGALIVTADHGNADEMGERNKKTGELKRSESGGLISRTSHSLNPVPFFLAMNSDDQERFVQAELKTKSIGNLAATALELMGFDTPLGYMPSLLAKAKS